MQNYCLYSKTIKNRYWVQNEDNLAAEFIYIYNDTTNFKLPELSFWMISFKQQMQMGIL